MKILIASGLKPKGIGGPAQYGPALRDEFLTLGHKAILKTFTIETALPTGIRHGYFFFKIFFRAALSDTIIALDTFSVGFPAVFLARLFGKKSLIRVGGDFLWETYVNRTGDKVPLSQFYKKLPMLSCKERAIYSLTKYLTKNATVLAFNTEWQREIWLEAYAIAPDKAKVVRNFMPESKAGENLPIKNFLFAGRQSAVKNLDVLKKVSEKVIEKHSDFRLDIVTDEPQERLWDRVRSSHAAILPSVSDVCPNFIIEAASYGKPFITTNETGIRELLPQGGIFIDSSSEEEIENAIVSLLDDSQYSSLALELKLSYHPRSWHELAAEYLAAL